MANARVQRESPETISLSLFKNEEEKKKEEERRRAARRFMTFHNRNVYTWPEGARLKKNKERKRERPREREGEKNNGARLYIYSR